MALGMTVGLLLQTVWVVDQFAGPGFNFTDLPPAVAAAADGDVLLVRAGQYSPFTLIGKGLRILGAGATTTFVRPLTSGSNTVTTISGIPPSSPVVLEDLTFGGF